MNIHDPKAAPTPDQKAHLLWMKKLKVGDLVCDCQFRHLRVKSIEEAWIVWVPGWWKSFCCHIWMPEKLGDVLSDAWEWVSSKFGKVLIDKDLVLEDGSQCSAIHCCDPVPHAWDHILSSKTDLQKEQGKELSDV